MVTLHRKLDVIKDKNEISLLKPKKQLKYHSTRSIHKTYLDNDTMNWLKDV